MNFRDWKYLAAYIIPVTCLACLYFGGWVSPGVLYFGFIIVPVVEYQTLRHLDDSPQLPFGCPMSIIIALIPPLWFRVMNTRLEACNPNFLYKKKRN